MKTMNQLLFASMLLAATNAPMALGYADQCIDGNCDDAAAYNNDGNSYDDGDDNVDDVLNSSLDQFKAYLTQHIEPQETDELYETLTESITLMHKHMERTLISKRAFPNALETTLGRAGNYTDGTKAGTPNWVGDEGAQNISSPTYVSFGSVLEIGRGTSGSGIPWLASLIHRRSIIDDLEARPCRTDLLDDYDNEYDDICYIGATLDDFVSVRVSDELRRLDMTSAAEFGILDKGGFLVKTNGNWLDMNVDVFGGKKFDTIFAESILAAKDDEDDNPAIPMHDMDLVIERLASFLKPGGTLYLTGKQQHIVGEYGPGGEVYHSAVNVLDAVKSLSREYPKHDLPASWVHRNMAKLGLNVYSSTLFPIYHAFGDLSSVIAEATEWVDDLESDDETKRGFYKVLFDLYQRGEDIAAYDSTFFAGGYKYIVTAELPSLSSKPLTTVVDAPIEYEYKERYEKDHDPAIEELAMPPIKPGELQEYKWANGDSYDGTSARIGIPPKLSETIRNYVKKLGIWDLMIHTMKDDPMPKNSTRFYTMASPYEDGKKFTWSAKRPDNFYGSDSNMHWFDVADEAAHEESLRVLAEGGFDVVLNAIGKYLGMEHIASFGIGLLAVSKADKGYVHVDFSHSGKRAFNFLINLQTPGDDPELTVIEEDELGNRRRGQVKYAPEFGVLNGDDAMHATNECNHRASGGVRITASIFLAELQEESLHQVAEHDKYYFPFGNMDWIWAQRGRHWNKAGTASLTGDKGRVSFVAEDEMEGCEEKVGEKKEKCLVHGHERMLCYKTCGAFISDDKYSLGEERRKMVGW
ncbi:hypothetical protein ACHAXR_012794 [Thalassiosira sp. AJA248-18]